VLVVHQKMGQKSLQRGIAFASSALLTSQTSFEGRESRLRKIFLLSQIDVLFVYPPIDFQPNYRLQRQYCNEDASASRGRRRISRHRQGDVYYFCGLFREAETFYTKLQRSHTSETLFCFKPMTKRLQHKSRTLDSQINIPWPFPPRGSKITQHVEEFPRLASFFLTRSANWSSCDGSAVGILGTPIDRRHVKIAEVAVYPSMYFVRIRNFKAEMRLPRQSRGST
jgi:hypothetical protein